MILSVSVTDRSPDTGGHRVDTRLTGEQPYIPVLILSLPPIFRRCLDFYDPVPFAERYLVVLSSVVAVLIRYYKIRIEVRDYRDVQIIPDTDTHSYNAIAQTPSSAGAAAATGGGGGAGGAGGATGAAEAAAGIGGGGGG